MLIHAVQLTRGAHDRLRYDFKSSDVAGSLRYLIPMRYPSARGPSAKNRGSQITARYCEFKTTTNADSIARAARSNAPHRSHNTWCEDQHVTAFCAVPTWSSTTTRRCTTTLRGICRRSKWQPSSNSISSGAIHPGQHCTFVPASQQICAVAGWLHEEAGAS